jgi:hypothetical protein
VKVFCGKGVIDGFIRFWGISLALIPGLPTLANRPAAQIKSHAE